MIAERIQRACDLVDRGAGSEGPLSRRRGFEPFDELRPHTRFGEELRVDHAIRRPEVQAAPIANGEAPPPCAIT